MAFTKTPAKTPAKIGRLAIHAQRIPQADGTVATTASIDFDVLDAGGAHVATQQADLLANLTAAQRTALDGLLDALATKAAAEAV